MTDREIAGERMIGALDAFNEVAERCKMLARVRMIARGTSPETGGYFDALEDVAKAMSAMLTEWRKQKGETP